MKVVVGKVDNIVISYITDRRKIDQMHLDWFSLNLIYY